ncbi:MAG: hypothetical protein KTV77_05625, partial [Wolbachia endosymbiont of Fragariocoptes setiger]|nr:hypothetical protein [Wolbachia endosymbiont of Fragariocoptes setiger]
YKDDNILALKLDIATQIGEERGKAEGEKQAKIEVAKAMLAENMEINTIAKFTGLSVREIEKLAQNP